MKCIYCGSERIEQGIAWGKSAETGNIGLKYQAFGGFLGGVVQIYSDLCLDCGAVLKTYINESAEKNWVKCESFVERK